MFERLLCLLLEHVDNVGGVESRGDGGAEVDDRDGVDLGVLLGEAGESAAGFEAGLAAVDADEDAAEDRSADRRPSRSCLVGVAFGFISDLPSRVLEASWK